MIATMLQALPGSVAQGGSPVSATELFGPSGPPAGGGR